MDCKKCESILIEYIMNELSEDERSRYESHLQECADCREALAAQKALINIVAGVPLLTPSASESASLASALANVSLQPQVQISSAPEPVSGLAGLIFASAAAFIAIVTLLALQVLGYIDIASLPSSLGYVRSLAIAIMVIIVTSFVPIAVTAYRRPLNGLTFRR